MITCAMAKSVVTPAMAPAQVSMYTENCCPHPRLNIRPPTWYLGTVVRTRAGSRGACHLSTQEAGGLMLWSL